MLRMYKTTKQVKKCISSDESSTIETQFPSIQANKQTPLLNHTPAQERNKAAGKQTRRNQVTKPATIQSNLPCAALPTFPAQVPLPHYRTCISQPSNQETGLPTKKQQKHFLAYQARTRINEERSMEAKIKSHTSHE